MIIFHFMFKMLKNPILKLELSRIFKNVSTSTKCPILQNGLIVYEILIIKKFKFSKALKIYLCIVKLWILLSLSQPYFGPSVGVKPNTPKVGNLESSGTLECSELDSKVQNTSHWGVLGVIGKILKRRYLKWPRIGHLDICSPSYGQKKGRDSNWQFDSRALKVENRPVPDVCSGSATWSWKALFEGYNFGSDLVPIRGRGEELWSPKVPGL
jgi:hypothetical protein